MHSGSDKLIFHAYIWGSMNYGCWDSKRPHQLVTYHKSKRNCLSLSVGESALANTPSGLTPWVVSILLPCNRMRHIPIRARPDSCRLTLYCAECRRQADEAMKAIKKSIWCRTWYLFELAKLRFRTWTPVDNSLEVITSDNIRQNQTQAYCYLLTEICPCFCFWRLLLFRLRNITCWNWIWYLSQTLNGRLLVVLFAKQCMKVVMENWIAFDTVWENPLLLTRSTSWWNLLVQAKVVTACTKRKRYKAFNF